MRGEWSPEELVESWTLLGDDWERVGNKSGATRLGFAVLLKFFELEAHFPRTAGDASAPLRTRSGCPSGSLTGSRSRARSRSRAVAWLYPLTTVLPHNGPAVRHATGKPVVQVMAAGASLPFDIKDYRTIQFEWRGEELAAKIATKLKTDIVAQLRSIQAAEGIGTNPVHAALSAQLDLELGLRAAATHARVDAALEAGGRSCVKMGSTPVGGGHGLAS